MCNKTQIDAQLKYPPLYLTITEKRQTSFIQYVTSKQSMSEDEESSQLIQNSGNDFRNLVAGMCYFIRKLNVVEMNRNIIYFVQKHETFCFHKSV